MNKYLYLIRGVTNMNKEEIINKLYDKDVNATYKEILSLEILSIESDELYQYFNEFLNMLGNDNSYIRIRVFRMICSLSILDKLNNRKK